MALMLAVTSGIVVVAIGVQVADGGLFDTYATYAISVDRKQNLYACAVAATERVLEQAQATLERVGLLLLSDPALPSLVGLIVGEPLRTSWWGHPRGGAIYHAMNALGDDPSVLSTKLVAGKVTYVHQRLWPAVYTLGCAREPWQLDNLSPAANWLLEQIDADGDLQTDLVVPPVPMPRRTADAARELERRLLVHAAEFHTPSGAHAKVLQSWPRWAACVNLMSPQLSVAQARRQLDEAAERLVVAVAGGVAVLPWQTRSRQSRRRGFESSDRVRARDA
jgi:hypothetical protein